MTLFYAGGENQNIKLAKLIQTVDAKGKTNFYFEYQTNDFLVSDKRWVSLFTPVGVQRVKIKKC